MVEKKGNTLIVGFHEWAWSLRTTGFPVYAIRKLDEKYEIAQIGSTRKQLSKYTLPDGTVAVFREYVTNRCYREYYIYVFKGDKVKEYAIYEATGFEPCGEVSEDDKEIIRFVKNWVLDNRL